MAWPTTGSEERPQRFTSKDNIGEYLGFHNEAAFDNWLSSESFFPLYKDFLEKGLKPALQKAVSEGKPRHRGCNLVSIEAVIKYGEMGGRRKYSNYRADRSSFNLVEWYAWVVLAIRLDNTGYRYGLFWQWNLSDHEKNCRIWSLLTFMNGKHARRFALSLKRKRKEDKAAARGNAKRTQS